METVEISSDALDALWANVDVSRMREDNLEAVKEVRAVMSAQESNRVTLEHNQ